MDKCECSDMMKEMCHLFKTRLESGRRKIIYNREKKLYYMYMLKREDVKRSVMQDLMRTHLTKISRDLQFCTIKFVGE